MSEPSDNFYAELPSFTDFGEVTADRHFRRVPDDWTVVITDIKGSTRAIEAGRYKDVNTVGAASIAAVQDAVAQEVPFVFGGDGTTLVLPPAALPAALDALCGVRRLALERFGMTLRVGMVEVGEVHAAGGTVEVARHELFAGKCIAIFRGGGLSLAEQRIKEDEARCAVPDRRALPSSLANLSCRWNPIPSSAGVVASLLIAARDGDANRSYESFLRFLRDLYGGDLERSSPIRPARMSYSGFLSMLWHERRLVPRLFSQAAMLRLKEIVICLVLYRWRVRVASFDTAHYMSHMGRHADHRKFDDMLRMVIDCTPDQLQRIRAWLEDRRGAGTLAYGIHESAHALMTCYVPSAKDGGHVHFIDGGDGGYAMAAKELKAQLKAG